MDEILVDLCRLIEDLMEEIEKLEDLADSYPELQSECLIKKEAFEEAIEGMREIISQYS